MVAINLFGRNSDLVAFCRIRNYAILLFICFLSVSCKPDADFRAFPSSGPGPLTVYFDASASNAREGSIISYKWDFDGNGTTDEEGLTASYRYGSGVFNAILTVTDEKGNISTAAQRITATGSRYLMSGQSSSQDSDSPDPYYDAKGLNPFREMSGMMPNETVDPFTGNLILMITPYSLPQKGGWNMKVDLVYNSKIFSNNRFSEYNDDYGFGIGWASHMGRLISPGSNRMSIEMPDGSSHPCYSENRISNSMSPWRTKDNWLIEKVDDQYLLTLTDGRKYLFESMGGVLTNNQICYPVTKITDLYNNSISVSYERRSTPYGGMQAFITLIRDTYSRQINFRYNETENYVTEININNERKFTFTYSTQTHNSRTYRLLSSVNAPDSLTWQFNYYVTRPLYELKSFVTPNGAKITYSYKTIYLHDSHSIPSRYIYLRAVYKKELDGELPGATWRYTYIEGCWTKIETFRKNGRLDATDEYFFHGYSKTSSGTFWLTGLLDKKISSYADDGVLYRGQQDSYTWEPHYVVNNPNRTSHYDDKIYSPVLKKKVIVRGVSKTYTTTYEGHSENPYGHPTKITESGDSDRVTDISYWYNPGLNIIDSSHIETRKTTAGEESVLDSYEYWDTGKTKTRNISGVASKYWYDYEGNLSMVQDANNNTIMSSNYSWGLPCTINRTAYTERFQATPLGEVKSKWIDGRSNRTSYEYADLGRLKKIIPPSGYATDFSYAPKGGFVKKIRGPYVIYTFYDALGNNIGSYEPGANTRKDISYDYKGRKIFESYPYTVGSFVPEDRIVENLVQENFDPNMPRQTPDPPYGLMVSAWDKYCAISWDCDSREVLFEIEIDEILPFITEANVCSVWALTPSSHYRARVRSINWYDHSLKSETASIYFSTLPLDTEPPLGVTGFSATSRPDSVELSWNGNTEIDLIGYLIECQESGSGAWTIIAYPGFLGNPPEMSCYKGMESWWVDSYQVARYRSYRFRIRAYDYSGNESEVTYSNWAVPGL